MNRRTFLATTAVAAAGSASVLNASSHESGEHRFLELIKFQVPNRPSIRKLENYLGEAVIPGLNKLGCSPIGVFRPKYGSHGGDVYLLAPHASIESFVTVWDKLAETEAFRSATDTEMDEPLYERMETTLMKAFSHMPEVEVPEAIKDTPNRVFELRIYESHNRLKGARKVEMFNEGGEIQIFRDTGLHPVFFGQTLAGPLMPNLVYLLGFKDLAERDENWKRFVASPAWKKLSKDPRYAGTVSTITDIILSPSRGSQI